MTTTRAVLMLAGSLLMGLVALRAAFADRTSLLGALGCAIGDHVPFRASALGGFRCSRCGLAGADLDAFGQVGDGYVPPKAAWGRRP